MSLDKHLLSGEPKLMDLSMLPLLPHMQRDMPARSLLVPRTLHEVLQFEATDELAVVLTHAIMPPDPTGPEYEDNVIYRERLQTIMQAYADLARSERIQVIDDEDVPEPELKELLDRMSAAVHEAHATLPNGRSVSSRGLVRRCLGTMFQFSKRTGTAILASGRSLLERVHDRMLAIRLPAPLKAAAGVKKEFVERYILPTEDLRTMKIYACMVIGTAGLFTGGTLIAAGGFAFAVIDP